MKRTTILAQQFRQDERGAIAIIFAVSLIVLTGVVGLAIDFGRAYSSRQHLQSALDAAVIAAAKASMTNLTTANELLQAHFKAQRVRTGNVTVLTLTGQSEGKGIYAGKLKAQLPTTFLKVLGTEALDLNVQSAAAYGTDNAEVALVLDTTASMAGVKLDTLKTAAKNLITTLHQAATGTVRVAVVPFASYVNVGMGNRNAPWMSVPPDRTETQNVCTTERPITNKSNCRMETFTATNDGAPYTYDAEVCDYEYGPETTQCADQTYSYTWGGCAGSRNYPLNTKDGDYSTPIPGVLNAYCPTPITPLTNEKNSATSAIDALTAADETYIPAGLAWGWRVLSEKAPYAEAASKPSGTPSQKYLVLMTDGTNTRSPSYPEHNGSDASTANTITAELCTNAKADGIRIFTVAFSVTDSTVKQLLRNCASSGGDFYDAAGSSDLLRAFERIGSSLTTVRIAR